MVDLDMVVSSVYNVCMSLRMNAVRDERCAGDNNNRVVTVFNKRICTGAAFTNSSRKQKVVVELALGEDLLDMRQVPFNASRTWQAISEVHAPAYRRGGALRQAETTGREPVVPLVTGVRLGGCPHLERPPCRLPTRP